MWDIATYAKSEWAEQVKAPHDRYYRGEYSYDLLSVAGSILSLKERTVCECGGPHKWVSTRFRAVNLAQSSPRQLAPLLLTDLSTEADIFKAL